MDKHYQRQRRIINLTSALPRKKNIVNFFLMMLVCGWIFGNYIFFTSQHLIAAGGYFNMMEMTRYDMAAIGIPASFTAYICLITILDVIVVVLLCIWIAPSISKFLGKAWDKFPD